jgi:SAM-dependent methyltransferase
MDDLKMKKGVIVVRKDGIHHLLDNKNKMKRFKPWLGDIFSFLYDGIMEKSVFPSKFQGSMHRHYEILKHELKEIHYKNILEMGTGSGDVVKFLNKVNHYTGVDISKGLLRIASKKLNHHRFLSTELFLADACHLPFEDHCFDIALCNLSLNFFADIDIFILELRRVLKQNATFYCSVPIPERRKKGVTIHGTLYSVEELRNRFQKHHFCFTALPYENGAIFYFRARLVYD